MANHPPVPRRRVSVFIPAFNEAEGIEPAVRGVLAAADVVEECEVLLVDDGSTDATGTIADRLAREDARVRVIHHPKNLGLRAAYESAVNAARMEYFTFVPGDNEMNPDSVRVILSRTGSADLIVPYHYNVWDRPWHRCLMTFVCTKLLNLLLGNRLKYYQGPNVYPTALARVLPRRSQGFFFLAEMTAYAVRMGYEVVHVGLIHQEREHGTSKAVTLKNIRRAIGTILRLWWEIRIQRKRIQLPEAVPPPRSRVDGWRIVPKESERMAI